MATEVILPALGESVSEGTVSRWLKAVGDIVGVDEPLLEISTDKVDTEIPSPVAGRILEIRFNEDDVAPVGAVLAVIGEPDQAPAPEPAAPPAPEPVVAPAAPVQPTSAPPVVPTPAPVASTGPVAPVGIPSAPAPQHSAAVAAAVARRAAESDPNAVYVTPLVRKLAADHGVDLAKVSGTGVGGRVRKQDVLDAAAAAHPQPSSIPTATEPPRSVAVPSPAVESLRGRTEKLSRLRTTIAKRMTESLKVAAQLTATVEVDLTSISRIRAVAKDDFKKREGASLSYLPFITKAAIEALKKFPVVNATIDETAGTVTYADAEHVGVAVDTEKGLLVPVIRDAGDLNVSGLAKKIADLAARTRTLKVSPDELTGSTFTITNYGSAGTLFDTPIINQPQVAILGTGALVKRPVVITDRFGADTIAVRDMMYLSLTYDHRLIDGAVAARFLSTIKARLEEGAFGEEFGV